MTNNNSSRPLNHDERMLWAKFTRSVSPLKNHHLRYCSHISSALPVSHGVVVKRGKPDAPQSKSLQGRLPSGDSREVFSTGSSSAKGISFDGYSGRLVERQFLSRRQIQRLSRKSRRGVDATIDLHGLNRDQAYQRVSSFLARSSQKGLKTVLIITGKGGRTTANEGRNFGILAASVRHWLETPHYRQYITGYQEAAHRHGGSGALYVGLKNIRHC